MPYNLKSVEIIVALIVNEEIIYKNVANEIAWKEYVSVNDSTCNYMYISSIEFIN